MFWVRSDCTLCLKNFLIALQKNEYTVLSINSSLASKAIWLNAAIYGSDLTVMKNIGIYYIKIPSCVFMYTVFMCVTIFAILRESWNLTLTCVKFWTYVYKTWSTRKKVKIKQSCQ